MTRLAERYTVIRYDKPGCGLSDRDDVDLSFEAQVAAAIAVTEAAGADRFTVFGASQGGQIAAAIAARLPDRVDAAVLYGTCGNGADLGPAELRESLVALVRAHWGFGSKVLTGIFVPEPSPAEIEQFTGLQQASASAKVAAELLASYYLTDVRPLLPTIKAPTVVLHRQGDPATRFRLGREIASLVPGSTLIPLSGPSHLFYHGDWTEVLDAMLGFLGGLAPEPQPDRPVDAIIERQRLTARELEVARSPDCPPLAAYLASDHVYYGELSQHRPEGAPASRRPLRPPHPRLLCRRLPVLPGGPDLHGRLHRRPGRAEEHQHRPALPLAAGDRDRPGAARIVRRPALGDGPPLVQALADPAGAAGRSTYVLASSAALALLYWLLRPVGGEIWRTTGLFRAVLLACYGAGWAAAIGSTFLIDHCDLFGLRQGWLAVRGVEYRPPPFTERSLYRYVRHLLMAGFVIILWAAPVMTGSHLLFATAATGYIGVGIKFEEHDLKPAIGEPYASYQARVPAICPVPRRRSS